MPHLPILASSAALLLAASSASAWQYRFRFVERVGNQDVVISENTLSFAPGVARRIRLQIGVFDDAAGSPPPGGVLGLLDTQVTCPRVPSRRTPGVLGAFANPLSSNGEPAADPFVALTNIDIVLGDQTLTWGCTANGATPLPMPTPVNRGINTFISVWEMTITPNAWCPQGDALITFAGFARAATAWTTAGTPVPPVCGVPTPTPGSVTYTPIADPAPPRAFSATLLLVTGSPPPNPPPYYDCPADWNRTFSLDSADFFAFLADFFAGHADANCDDATNSADFFYFLQRFMSDCTI